MSSVTETDPKFVEDIAGQLYAILRAAGVSMMNSESQERLRDVSVLFAQTIEHRAEQKAIQVIKKLQGATSAGFKAMEDDVALLKGRLDILEEEIEEWVPLEEELEGGTL